MKNESMTTLVVGTLLVCVLFVACDKNRPAVDFGPASAFTDAATRDVRSSRQIVTGVIPRVDSQSAFQLGQSVVLHDSAITNLAAVKLQLDVQQIRAELAEKEAAKVPGLQLKLAEARGNVWKWAVISGVSGLVLGALGLAALIFFGKNTSPVGWLVKLLL